MKRTFPNYNAKTYRSPREIFQWSEATGIPLKVYENFDGGGWNFNIVEFLDRAELDRFRQEFDVFDRAWIEIENGRHQDIE